MLKHHLGDICTHFAREQSKAKVKRPDGKIWDVKTIERGLESPTTSSLRPLLLWRIRFLPATFVVEPNYPLGYGLIQQSYPMLQTANLGLINTTEGFPPQPIAGPLPIHPS